LIFEAGSVESLTGGRSWSVALSGVVGAEERPRAKPFFSESIYSGALRSRLQVNLASGDTELFAVSFVINRVPDLIRLINTAVEDAAED
jgi:hypothetical protein